jgi:anaerobic selenocysteine-containing dehydrogenase
VMGDPRLAAQAPVLLYRTMDLPPELREGAVLLGLALRTAMQSPEPLARAGFEGSPLQAAEALFRAVLERPSGVVFSVDDWGDVIGRIATPDGKIHLALPDLLGELARLVDRSPRTPDPAFPFVLSAGERRSFTANTIIRDPAWRKTDPEGALRMCPADAGALGVRTGDRVRLSTRRGSAIAVVEVSDSLQAGHISLPNGMGLTYPGARGEEITGIAPNELTSTEDRDPFVGTPWHKSVPARVERA